MYSVSFFCVGNFRNIGPRPALADIRVYSLDRFTTSHSHWQKENNLYVLTYAISSSLNTSPFLVDKGPFSSWAAWFGSCVDILDIFIPFASDF